MAEVVEALAPTVGAEQAPGSAKREREQEWCESLPLLHSLFKLDHCPVSTLQGDGDCVEFGKLFHQFTAQLVQANQADERGDLPGGDRGDPLQRDFSSHDCQALLVASDVVAAQPGVELQPQFGIRVVKWLPFYGAAILAISAGASYAPDNVHLHVIGLDGWRFETHRVGTEHDSSCEGGPASSLPVEPAFAIHELQVVVSLFIELLAEQARKWGGGRSHLQKTPAMVHAVLQAAVRHRSNEEKLPTPNPPKGGFTDVGIHTGGNPRDTCWALIRVTIQVILERGCQHPRASVLFRQAMTHFALWLTERQLACTEATLANSNQPRTASPADHQSAVMRMLQCVVHKASRLAEDGYVVESVEERCGDVLRRLQALAASRGKDSAKAFQLHLEMVQFADCRNLQVKTGSRAPASTAADGQGVMDRAKKNLDWLPKLSNRATFADMLCYMEELKKHMQTQHTAASQLLLRTVEHAVFQWIMAESWSALPMDEITALEKILDEYRLVLNKFLADKPPFCGQAQLRVELSSRERLLAWAIYVMVDHAARSSHSKLMAPYGVSLRWQDLRHMVLADRLAMDVARKIAGYLRTNTKQDSKTLFTLRDETGTFEFAQRYCGEAEDMRFMWTKEKEAAERRTQAHWQEVQDKQAQCERLRAAEWKCEQALAEALRTRTGSRDRLAYKNSLEAVRKELREAEKSPPPVLQPLPKYEQSAFKVMFFLFMPPLFRVLSRLSFTAQQLLVPQPGSVACDPQWEVLECCRVEPGEEDWCAYYNTYSKSKRRADQSWSGKSGAVLLHSNGKRPEANAIGPQHVDNCQSPADGVWYPDALKPRMIWKGGNFPLDEKGWDNAAFNPFHPLPTNFVTKYCTERLPDEYSDLQWMVPQYGFKDTDLTRGNLPLANLDQKPVELEKVDFLAMGTLRAYPHIQLRKLCVGLSTGSLPLANPMVGVLIRQTLYHLGDLSDSDLPFPTWRGDLHADPEAHELMITLQHELDRLASLYEPMPREHLAVPILAEIAAYLSEWHLPCRATARRFAGMTSTWASDLDVVIADADFNPQRVSMLRAKQCMFRLLSLLCYNPGVLDSADAAQICMLIVLAQQGRTFGDDSQAASIAELTVRCQNMMATIMDRLLPLVVADTSMLTSAVSKVLPDTPQVLTWTEFSVGTACFEATFETTTGTSVYHVNVMTGTVLLDGYPPRRLGNSIINHPLYIRVFGRGRNFEVVKIDARQQIFKTVQEVDGYFYQFYMSDEGNLTVLEIDDMHGGLTLELLDCTEKATWTRELPVRLRELHSHWYCREKQQIMFRGVGFRDRNPAFILAVNVDTGLDDGDTACFRVPLHQQSLHWTDILDSWQDNNTGEEVHVEKLVKHDSRVTAILGKFESPDFIHVYTWASADSADRTSTCPCFKVELPRYKLSFELQWDGNAGTHSLVSLEHRGYHLVNCQQLEDTLYGFQQYLLLERSSENADMVQRPKKLMLVPEGEVLRNNSGVRLRVPLQSGAELSSHVYEVSTQFGQLKASTIASRLQLAALYAATSSLLPEPRVEMTGAEVAMQYVRQCSVNQPLTPKESDQLRTVATHGPIPALILLCHQLELSSKLVGDYLPFASFSESIQEPACSDDMVQAAKTMYLNERHLAAVNPRQSLTAAEERQLFGGLPSAAWATPKHAQLNPQVLNDMDSYASVFKNVVDSNLAAAVDFNIVQGTEQWLSEHVTHTQPAAVPFPLEVPTQNQPDSDTTALRLEMVGELEHSWQVHQTDPVHAVRGGQHYGVQTSSMFSSRLSTVVDARAWMERMLKKAICHVPPEAVVLRLQRIANISPPTASLSELAQMVFDRNCVREHNRYIPDAAAEIFQAAIQHWLQLCVLEDKLRRIIAYASSEEHRPMLVQELHTRRTWEPAKHPRWLVFEAEGRLQIRPKQYDVAKHMFSHAGSNKHNGSVVQLNMGEGKTRVILPMLILYWADDPNGNHECLLRLNLLSTLLDEAFCFMHNHLCASVLACKLFQLPFHRDVELEPSTIHAMTACLNLCLETGGVLMVAPEHRLSLQLKRQELELAQEPDKRKLCKDLEAFDCFTYRDVLDESDEVLRHKYQLLYAVGSPVMLPSGQARWRAVQELLRILVDYPEFQTFFEKQDVAIHVEREFCEEYASELRLLKGEALNKVKKELRETVARALVSAPPRHMLWLLQCDTPTKESFIKFMTDAGIGADMELKSLEDVKRDYLLALRGLLAYGILEHCLMKRHRVDFGVDRFKGRKRLAIPFRACETPVPRAEFGHPDVALVLTHLSYYYDGLSEDEIKTTVATLLRLPPNAQELHYNRWFERSQQRLDKETRSMLDDVKKLDLSNSHQVGMLKKYFGRNFEVINFWLEECMLPEDMTQYPQRLAANAWHLVDNKPDLIVGFSGTSDSHRLLPLRVKQERLTSLEGTDGRMLALILENPAYVMLDDQGTQLDEKLDQAWHAVLDSALEHDVNALIDCGALLAGAVGREAAEYLLRKLRNSFLGVVYFDTDAHREWMVHDRYGQHLPLHKSPVEPRHAFVIFDESRCRGADMKLLPSAKALLTVGVKTTKDKLMQAAGRMRMIGKGQQVILAGPEEITQQIRKANGLSDVDAVLTSRHVLEWVMLNTVEATEDGLLEWAAQGVHFACTKNDPASFCTDEKQLLEDFYLNVVTLKSMSDASTDLQHHRLGAFENGRISSEARCIIDLITQQTDKYGKDVFTMCTSLDEECEREVHKEVQEEQEIETQYAKMKPYAEVDWDYECIVRDSLFDAKALPSAAKVTGLNQAVAKLVTEDNCGMFEILWSKKVFSTSNFIKSVVSMSLKHLRQPDALLEFPNGDLVFISERETDQILGHLWGRRSSLNATVHPRLVHLQYEILAGCQGSQQRARLQIVPSTFPSLPDPVLASRLATVMLFAGESMFPEEGLNLKRALRELVATDKAKTGPTQLLEARGLLHHYAYSDVEEVCELEL